MTYRISINSAGAIALLVLLGTLTAGCPLINPGNSSFSSADVTGAGGAEYEITNAPGTEVDEGTQGEREVVEPDVMYQYENLLYVLNQYRGLSIIDLASNNLLSQAPTYGYPRDLYVVGSRAYVLVGYANDVVTDGDVVRIEPASKVYVLDIADPSAPEIEASFTLEGDLVDSRLVGEVLYAVSAKYTWYWNKTAKSLEKNIDSTSWVSSLDLSDPSNVATVDTLSFEGYGNVIQATSSAIFVAAPDWSSDSTTISYVDISDPGGAIEVRGAITLDGYVTDRFKLNAYEGVLRVVSSTGWSNREVYVSTVDLSDPDTLTILGQTTIEDAAGETLFATRFDGPRAYVVTYFMVDPLFVLDLSDPANPLVTGKLEVPGWSTHIEARGDRLIALGVDDTDGRKVCVSVFDVSDPAAPGLIDRESFGEDWTWSSAYGDVKAFTVLDDMLIVPFSGWNQEGGFDRLQFIDYQAEVSGESALSLRGAVDLEGGILRSFAYEDVYYGVTTEQLTTIDASASPEITATLTLAEYLNDFIPYTSETALEIVSRFDQQSTCVRSTTYAGEVIDAIDVEMNSVENSFLWQDTLVLVSRHWDEQARYEVILIDCAEPTELVAAPAIKVDVEPWWDYWWFQGYNRPIITSAGEQTSVATIDGTMSYWGHGWEREKNSAFLLDNTLALRCLSEDFDSSFGDANAHQGLAIIDLNTATWTQTVGLGYPHIETLGAAGDKLYLSTKETLSPDKDNRPRCAYYLREFDLLNLSMGPAVNVPGIFLSYSPDSEQLLLGDYQYGEEWFVHRSVQSLYWNGAGNLQVRDELKLPNRAGTVQAAGTWLYYDTYEEGYALASVQLDQEGALIVGPSLSFPNYWGNLIAAQEGHAFLAAGGTALLYYHFEADQATLVEMLPVMNTPYRMRFANGSAYAPLGYAGLATLPLQD